MCELFEDFEVLFTEFGKKRGKLYKEVKIKSAKFKISPFIIKIHIYRKDKNGCFVFDFFGSDLSKMDQT